MFITGFNDFVCHGDKISCEVDGITYTARVEVDLDSNPNDFDCYSDE